MLGIGLCRVALKATGLDETISKVLDRVPAPAAAKGSRGGGLVGLWDAVMGS